MVDNLFCQFKIDQINDQVYGQHQKWSPAKKKIQSLENYNKTWSTIFCNSLQEVTNYENVNFQQFTKATEFLLTASKIETWTNFNLKLSQTYKNLTGITGRWKNHEKETKVTIKSFAFYFGGQLISTTLPHSFTQMIIIYYSLLRILDKYVISIE